MATNKPLFVVFDGIDGSGKSTVARAFTEELARTRNLRTFDLTAWSKEHHRLPLPDECEAQLVHYSEPTHVWLGAAIREELIRAGTDYDGKSIAEAFALDKLILHARLLIPLRKAGKTIVADRGVSSSIAYQPLRGITRDDVVALPGNALALTNAPDVLVICECEPERAIERLAARADKRDNSIYERLEVLRKLDLVYRSADFRRIFEDHGTHVVNFDANVPLVEMKQNAIALAHSL